MKSAVRVLLICALTLLAGAGTMAQEAGASAQGQGDPVLERFDLALSNLEESRRALGSDPASSREELDRAAGALRFLATQAQRPDLVEAMERVVDRARTAVSNRSSADLSVQTALLQGGFQRALLDSAVLLWETEPATARSRIDRLTAELAFSEAASARVAGAETLTELLQSFEAAVAEEVAATLQRSQELTAEGHADAYPVLARAYADYLLIHDSPRVDPRLSSSFAAAAEALVGQEDEALQDTLTNLSSDFGGIAEAAAGMNVAAEGVDSVGEELAAAADATTDEATEGESAPAQSPGADPAAEASDRAEGAATAAGTPGGLIAAAGQPPIADEPAATPADGDASEAEGTAEGLTAAPAAPVQDPAEIAREGMTEELVAAGLSEGQAQLLARELVDSGAADLQGAVDRLVASAARFTNLLAAGDTGAAAGALGDLSAMYRDGLGQAAASLSPEFHAQTLLLLETVEASPAGRAVDAQVLQAQIGELEALLAGGGPATIHYLNGSVTALWIQWIRPILTIVVALLAILPLYLLNLAFGGGSNRNWRFVGTALFLVLLPLFFEGLIAVLGLVSHYTGMTGLEMLSAYSLLGSPLGQGVWTILTTVAVILLSAGFYGICVQFGLIRGRSRAGASVNATGAGGTVVDTSVDWDEEY